MDLFMFNFELRYYYINYYKAGIVCPDQGADVSAHAFFSAHEAKKQHHTYIDTITNC